MTEQPFRVGQSSPELHEQRVVHRAAAFLLPYLKRGIRLLDCGCGPGTITLGLAEVVAPGEVVGVDVDPARFAPAVASAAQRGVSNVTFQQGDIHALPFEGESFDAVFVSAVLMHLLQPELALAELFRVLKRGGFLGARERHADADTFTNMTNEVWEVGQIRSRYLELQNTDLRFGRKLPSVVVQAGFDIRAMQLSPEASSAEARARAGDMLSRFLHQQDLVEVAAREGWGNQERLDQLASAFKAWISDPATQAETMHRGVVAVKP